MSTNSSAFTIILGSSSMARRQILTEMGYEFTIMSADIDEKVIRREKPADLVMALAEAKADAIVSRLKSTAQFEVEAHSTLLITADTIIQGYFLLLHLIDFEVVVYEGIIREKPSSKEEAREFIKGYSGGQAEVVGSVLVTNLKTGKRKGGWDRAEVYFYNIPDEVIDSLINEGFTLNVAGGLMLEHPMTLPFVEAVVGTTDTVMGLPKALTEKCILEAL
ncbi:7-methyl-GTP pyrophosphatase-like isoform X2 [Juglans microcarpa x Juglans regia]|nr:7-methyl-GTP pyrophosphatase-like isoform X2 [Juglans microcarpa x Juglans regia]XP_041009222.1 7-methyl-GTP pyrophosphatase-like isoform X2 [Juglans microcarpa x Juglans regia]